MIEKIYIYGIITKFIKWNKYYSLESYDPYDLWSTKYGLFARRIYYNNKILSVPFISPIIIADTYFPQIRKLFIRKKRYPIADAHFIMGYLNLFEVTKNEEYLSVAINISGDLLKTSISGFSGYCWGYPFDWQNSKCLWKKGTPFITITPYCFEAFLRLFDVTKEQKYLDIAFSISKFSYNDLNFSEMNDNTLASSYSPFDNSKVINASAYNSFLLTESYRRFNEIAYKLRAEKLLGFVTKSQAENGAWIYAIENPNDDFIDNIHTCFVLKNLIKANQIMQLSEIDKAIEAGYQYYLSNLLDKQENPKSFAKSKKINLVKVDLYDYAEGITLGLLMTEKNKEAKILVENLIEKICNNFTTKNGSFTSKVNNLGVKLNIPYLRWPQAQLFYALTSYLKLNKNNISES